MTEKYDELLNELELRMKQLMLLCDSLKVENDDLKSQLSLKEKIIASLDFDLEQLKTKHESLIFAKSLVSSDKDESKKAKAKLSKLVQDIDKCITLLKN